MCFKDSFSLNLSQKVGLVLSHASFSTHDPSAGMGIWKPPLGCMPSQLAWPFGLQSPRGGHAWSVGEEYNDGDLQGNLLHLADVFLDLCVSWPVVSMIQCFRFQIISSVIFIWYFGSLLTWKRERKDQGKEPSKSSVKSFFCYDSTLGLQREKVRKVRGERVE